MPPVVAVTDYTFPEFTRYERELAAAQAKLVVPARRTLEGFLEIAGSADAVLHEHLELSAGVIARMERCRVIAHHGKGVDNIDIAAASARGIVVANVLDASPHEVSEHVLALMLAVARRLRHYDAAVREGLWDVRSGEPAFRLHGKVLGLVGFGLIAQHVASKARALGMRIIVWARRRDDALASRIGVDYATLDDVFGRSDVLSLHLPLTPDTAGIASRARLARMKPTAILINVSRGALVDETALAEQLVDRRLFGAGLDVLAVEPPDGAHPLAALNSVLLTPHCAWYSEEGRDDVERRTARSAADVLQGIEPASWVNPEAGPAFEARWGPLRSRSMQGENV